MIIDNTGLERAQQESSGDFLNNQFYSFDAPTDFNLNQEDGVNFPIPTLGDYNISGDNILHKSSTHGIYGISNTSVASNSNHWDGIGSQYDYNSTPCNYNYAPANYSGISGNFTNSGSYTNIPGNFAIPGSYNSYNPANYNTFYDGKMPDILNYTSDCRNKENNYNTPSSTSSIQTPKKCIILKPVPQNSNSKSNLKYTIIRSFTPSRRAHSSAPIRGANSETETIAQKIPISLPKIILDVAKPKVDSFDQNVVSDRSTIYRVRELPQHVQNVIGGLTKTVKTAPASRPLVVDASQFQNRIRPSTNFTQTTNYQMGFNNTQPAQATSSWNVDNNWRNNYFGQTHMSGYLNNMGFMSNNGYAASSQMPQNVPIFPTTSTPSSISFTSDLPNKTTQNIVEMTKSTNLTSDDLKIDDFLNELTSNNTGNSEEFPKTTNFTTNVDWNTLGTAPNSGIVDQAVTFSTPTQAVNTPRISTPKKLDKVVPTIITGTRIIPNVPCPSKNRLNNVFGNDNMGQSTINGSNFRTKHYDSEKNCTGTSFAAYNNNTGSMSKPNIIKNNMSTSRLNFTSIGRTTDTDCKSNVSIPPLAKIATSRIIENKPNFVNDQHNSTNLKTDLGNRMNNSIPFDNTNSFNKSITIIPDNSTMSSTNIFGNIDATTNFKSSGTNVEFKDKASSITDDDLNFFTGNTSINNSCNPHMENPSHSSPYPNVFGSLEGKNIFPTNTSSSYKKGGIFDELSNITDAPYFQTVENNEKYNIVRASSLLDECEKILPINSEEEELLNTPDCAFDNSFNVDMPTNVSNTVSDVFGVHKNTNNNDNCMNKNTTNISQAVPIETNASQDNSLDFSVTLDLPIILESEFRVKEENETDGKEVENLDKDNCEVGTLKDVEDLSLLPTHQEVSKDFSFGPMKEEQCDGKIDEFDIDSLIEEKNKEFEMGEEKKDEEGKRNGEEERTDSNEESCTSITIKEEEKNDDEGESLKIEEKSSDSIDDVGGDKSSPCNLSEVMCDDFKQHFKSHCKKNDYVCEVCNKSFKHETTLKTHFTRCHTNENRKYKCNVCEQSFGVWRLLRDHRETVHPSLDKHCCYICEKLFPNKTALKAHVQRHTDPRRYKCQYCDKVYKDRAGLNVHLVVHTQVSKFSCSLCDRKFGKKNLLTDHMKIFHLKQKDHTCHECNRSFSTKNTLKRHSWIHTGEKNYICEICGRPFRQKVALTVHMKVHNKPQRAQHHAFQCNNGVGMNLCGDGGGNLPGYKHIYEDNTNNIDSKPNDFVIL